MPSQGNRLKCKLTDLYTVLGYSEKSYRIISHKCSEKIFYNPLFQFASIRLFFLDFSTSKQTLAIQKFVQVTANKISSSIVIRKSIHLLSKIRF